MGCCRIDANRCKGCDLCIDVCPKQCLATGSTLNRLGYYPVVLQDPESCNGCALCAQVCPDTAIRVFRKVRASA
ncbi:MAG: ferredoxin family protein [Phycisphaerae bacterium]